MPAKMKFHPRTPDHWQDRENYPALERSRILKPVDDNLVWSVTCFLVHKRFRGQVVTAASLNEVLKFVSSRRGKIVEGYPVAVKGKTASVPVIYTGTATAYKQAGFAEVASRSATRPILRFTFR